MLKLFRYMKKFWFTAILAPLFMVLEVAMDMVLSQYMEKMVDLGIQTGNFDNVVHYGLIMIAILFAGIAGGILSDVFTNITCYRFGNELRKEVFHKIMNLSLSQTDQFKTGSLVTRVTNDITQVQNMIAMCLRGLIRALSFFVLGIFFTLSISTQFGFILAIILPLEILILILFMKVVFPIFTIIQQKLDKVNQVVLENVTGARVVKAFSKEPYEYDRFVFVNDDYTETNLHVSKISAFVNPLLQLIVYFGQIVIYYLGGTAIVDYFQSGSGELLMVGQVTQAITYITMICHAITMLGMMFTNLARAYASGKRINEVLDCPVELLDGKNNIQSQERGTITFKNVAFSYPDEKKEVLSHINLSIHQGETVAIVGSTGCGKSTLVNLLVRFYDCTEGEVDVDNINVKDYDKKKLREKISFCLQKSELFAGTIADNIAFGKQDATKEEIQKAAQLAQAEEFILTKEKGYDEPVLEKGASLSGGQKQRISIARALIRHPEILIFDDSTSALDLLTEAKLYEGMKKELQDVTKIIVAQRIATAKNADKILVLDKGTIVAYDCHEALMQNCQIYKDIYLSQLQKEEC